MPISPNNLQFSLPGEYIERLRAKSQDGESLGLTAKRIIIAALDADREDTNTYQLSELVDRIAAIEKTHSVDENLPERLTAIEKAIAALQYQLNQATSPVKPPSRPPRKK